MMESFNIDTYRHHLDTSWLGSELFYKEEVASTNSVMKQLKENEISHGSIFLADYQSAGRGQYNRPWKSDKDQNLTFTIAFKPGFGDRLPLLTLCCALGVARTIDHLGIAGCKIKWPNDIMIRGKKVGGVLTESVFMGSRLERVLIGIGLNVNQTNFETEAGADATSISLEKEEPVEREKVLSRLLSEIEHLYTRWNRRDFGLCKDVNQRLIGFGEWVTASMNGTVKDEKYKFLGMNHKGECIMLNEDLNVHTFTYEQIRVFPNR